MLKYVEMNWNSGLKYVETKGNLFWYFCWNTLIFQHISLVYFKKIQHTFQRISTLLLLRDGARAGSAGASRARAGRRTSRGWAGGWAGHNISVGGEAREPTSARAKRARSGAPAGRRASRGRAGRSGRRSARWLTLRPADVFGRPACDRGAEAAPARSKFNVFQPKQAQNKLKNRQNWLK